MLQRAGEVIQAAAQGDAEAVQSISQALTLVRAMQSLFQTRTLRDALMIVGKCYGGVSVQELAHTFRVSKATVSKYIGERHAENQSSPATDMGPLVTVVVTCGHCSTAGHVRIPKAQALQETTEAVCLWCGEEITGKFPILQEQIQQPEEAEEDETGGEDHGAIDRDEE